MSTSELFICKLTELKSAKSFIKFFDELKDEVILYLDKDGNVQCFSSVCPHLAGEIVLSEVTNGLQCKWHGLEFNEKGEGINCKGKLSLRKYNSVLRNEGVYITYEL